MKTTFPSLLWFAIILAGGCAGDDDGAAPSCEFDACGGDFVGTWTVEQSCLSSSRGLPMCPEARFDVSNVTIEGAMELRADGSYHTTASMVGTMGLTLPASCVPNADCAGFGPFLLQVAPDEFESVECTGTETCSCDVVGKPQVKDGSYTQTDNLISVTTTNSMGDEDYEAFEYCANGDSLQLRTPEPTGAGPADPIDMSLALTR